MHWCAGARRLIVPIPLHPLAPLVCAYILGISITTGHLTYSALAVYTLVITAWSSKTWSAWFLWPTGILSTALLGSLIWTQAWHNHLQRAQALPHVATSIRGPITELGATDHPFYKTRLTINVTQIKPEGDDWRSASFAIQLYVPRMTGVTLADTIEVANLKIKQPTDEKFNAYLARGGICATCFVDKPDWRIVARPHLSIKRWLYQIKKGLRARLKAKMNGETFALFSSVFLGNKEQVAQSLEPFKHSFRSWGISHYLARSGLHLLVFMMMLMFLLAYVPLPYGAKQLSILFLSITYFLLTWSSISFLRAFWTLVLYKICQLLDWQIHVLHILTLVCLGTLVTNPLHIFFLDFQLSFALTFALAWLHAVEIQLKQA